MKVVAALAATARRARCGLRCWARRVVLAQTEIAAIAADMVEDQRRRTTGHLPLIDDELSELLRQAAQQASRVRRAAWRGRDVDAYLADAATTRLVRADLLCEAERPCLRCQRPAALHCPSCWSCSPDDACTADCELDPRDRGMVVIALERYRGRL